MRQIKHIAFLLSAVLLTPIGLQHHHLKKYHSGPDCSHHCNLEHHADRQSSSKESHQQPESPESDKPGHCPVLDFEYFANELPTPAPEIRTFSQGIILHVPAELSTGFQLYVLALPPRAPPVTHS